jgi:hypothetical protein
MSASDLKKPLFLGAGVDVTEPTLTQTLLNLGLLEGPQGRKLINPNVRPLVDAIYHVLCGGEAIGEVPGTITIKPGSRSRVTQLKALEKKRLASVSKVLDQFGFHAIT